MAECYEIRLRGQAGDLITAAFEDMSVASEPRTTVLRGVLDDQAALHGVLSRCRDLGMEIVEVRVVRVPLDADAPVPRATTRRSARWAQVALVVAALCILVSVVVLAMAGDHGLLVASLVGGLVLLGAFAWRVERSAGQLPR